MKIIQNFARQGDCTHVINVSQGYLFQVKSEYVSSLSPSQLQSLYFSLSIKCNVRAINSWITKVTKRIKSHLDITESETCAIQNYKNTTLINETCIFYKLYWIDARFCVGIRFWNVTSIGEMRGRGKRGQLRHDDDRVSIQ